MKKLLRAVMLLSVVGNSCIYANSSEFRSRQDRLRRGVLHSPLSIVEEAWWSDLMPEQVEEDRSWQLETWAAGWRMVASAAFDARHKGSTAHTTSLSQLWFGKDSFRGEEIFVGGQVNDPILLTETNPFLGFARISPSFDYNEHGVMAGLSFRHTFGEDDCWHVGFRVSLPVIEIEIEQDAGCALEETLADVVQRIPTNLDADPNVNQVDYAYRLDLLSSLARPSMEPDLITPIVQYGDGTGLVDTSTRIGGQYVAATTAEGLVFFNVAVPAAYVIRSNGTNLVDTLAQACGSDNCKNVCKDDCGFDSSAVTGTIPPYPYRKTAAQVTGQLGANGAGGGDQSVLFFQLEGVNYSTGLALDRAAQGELFVVPRANPANDTIYQSGVDLDQAVQSILQFIDPSETATQFFMQNGIDFCALDRVVGVGDLYTEVSVGYGNYQDGFGDFLFGLIFPTGTPSENANKIYHKPTGNNHHFEIRLGIEGAWMGCDWFGLRGDASFFHAFKAKECRAIPFNQTRTVTTPTTTTTDCCNKSNDCCFEQFFVKNIGNGAEFDVSWNYFIGHVDFTFFHPYNPEIGATIGYELMAKGHDHVSLDCDTSCGQHTNVIVTNTATDLLGRTGQAINLEVLEQNTDSMTHKIYGELFHRWNYFELFAGASQIVGGKHAMQETEAHIGMKVFF